jgi:glycosyltransferase involved in cell wall biosynthesis
MELCLTLEHRFLQTPDGKIWTVTQCPYSFFQEYLEVFDNVRVIARVFPVDKAGPDFLEVEGPGVEFYPMPSYKGPYGYVANWSAVAQRARNAVPDGAAVILRAHSQIANVVEKSLASRKYPYAVDVVADPYDVLSPAANRHPIAPIARRYFTSNLKRQCQSAIAVAYVTKTYLQQRYPPHPESVIPQTIRRLGDIRQRSIGVSDVSLTEDAFVQSPRTERLSSSELRVAFVGTLESLYKGPDVLVDAIALCKAKNLVVQARFVGGGRQMESLRERSARLGVHGVVEFVGSVTAGQGVRNELDNADLFVLPSRAEGVPRAMVEAMARGIPCLGTNVGGIPELLEAEDMVPQDDAAALAKQIIDVATNPVRFRRMAHRNLRKAITYGRTFLAEPRRLFYESVRDLTFAHLGLPERERSAVPQLAALVVAHVVEGCQGGVGTAVRHLIEGQSRDEKIGNIHLLADPVRMGDMLLNSPAVMHNYKSSRSPLRILKVASEVQSQLAALKTDVVFLHSTFPGLYGRLRIKNIHPEWTTLYCAHGWAFTQLVSSLKRSAYMLIERTLASRADAIVSISHHEHWSAVHGGLRHPLHRVIFHGVPPADGSLLPAVFPDEQNINLLFIGRFDRQKGVDLLVEAWKDSRLKQVHLWLIGAATLGSGTVMPRQQNVHPLGWVSNGEIDRYIRSFHAVIMPSRWEGFGLVALEAMRNGRAVLASRTGGLQELVIDGANGRLFDPEDREGLIQMLRSLSHRELARMGDVAGAVFRTAFEWDSCYQRWSALSLEAMESHRSTFIASNPQLIKPKPLLRPLSEFDGRTRRPAA